MQEKSFLRRKFEENTDLVVILITWALVMFTVISNFVFYQIADPADLFFISKNWTPSAQLGLEKAVESLKYLGGVAITITAVFLLDRLIASRKAENLKFIELKNGNLRFGRKINLTILIVLFLSLPWFFAQLGIYIGDIPVLSSVFFSKQIPDLEGQRFPTVHLGHHHGWDGAVIFSLMLLLIPSIKWIYDKRIKVLALAGLSVMISFSFYQFAEDFINEQVLKRLLIQNFLPGPGSDLQITLPLSILTGAFIYFLLWKQNNDDDKAFDE